MAPKAVLMKTGLKSIKTARLVNTVRSKFINAWVPERKPNFISFVIRANSHQNEKEHIWEAELLAKMCDKKNYVLFTDSECLVLSPNFKLPDENQILLKIPRQDNMYSFDMKNIVPKDSLTCLVAKATSEESMLWHRRLGHINFKNINKLVKENLVRDLPLKRFENDQTCVACLKGKQHRASLVTDDYSRFSWVFFLSTKDETTEILKNFIKEVENLVDKKVKIIRSDNGTEFKNKVMDDFCREKGIKREYSVARTPQQNGVAERKNRTLIEAARTMLADSKLPTTFWAEAVSTACYLGKFDGKSNEGFFVGYSLSSKAFRVYNTRTRKVQENLHIGFLENKPMIEGNGPKWLFDLDSLTQSMNYVPVVAGTFSNDFADKQGVSESSTFSQQDQDCIVMPIWKDASYFGDDAPRSVADAQIQDKDRLQDENDASEKSHEDSSLKDNGTADQQVNTASSEVNTGSRDVSTAVPEVNTATPEDLVEPSHASEVTQVEDQEIELGNILQSYAVATTPHTRIQKDHPIDHVIGDVQSSVQIRRMTSSYSELEFIVAYNEGKTHKDLHTCLFACFLSWEEPKRVSKALSDPTWVEAMQEELLQFKLQKELWNLKDSSIGINLLYTDSDYAGATQDRKSTTRGCQFLGNRLISWQCKKQTVVATSTTEAEYVAAANCCGQVLWIQNQLLDYGYNFMNTVIYIDNTSTICIIENHVQHSKTKHIEIRHHFIRDCNAKKLIQMAKIDTEHNVADLLTKGFDAGRFQYLVLDWNLNPNGPYLIFVLLLGGEVNTAKAYLGKARQIGTLEFQREPIVRAALDNHYVFETHELSEILVTKLSERIGVLEDDLKKTKLTYSAAVTKLILRVKKLEAQVKAEKARKGARVVISEDDEDVEDDSSKQGRKLSDAEVQEKASNEV
ncbi:ribonuclease H-like domain-containing protein [Tanacetum coccineum]